jgi:hypothetical protein
MTGRWSPTHPAEVVAEIIGKTPSWVKRNAQRLPHTKLGRTYTWTDEDIEAILEAARYRPAQPDDEGSDELRPLNGRRAS